MVYVIAILLRPYMPSAAGQILKQLGFAPDLEPALPDPPRFALFIQPGHAIAAQVLF